MSCNARVRAYRAISFLLVEEKGMMMFVKFKSRCYDNEVLKANESTREEDLDLIEQFCSS